MTQGDIKIRIKSHRKVRAGDLIPNPLNWREHPPQQIALLDYIMRKIGYISDLPVIETPDGLMIIDGHARADLDPDAKVPVAIVDLTEEEVAEMLTLYDPVGNMSRTNTSQVELLSTRFTSGNDLVNGLLAGLLNDKLKPFTFAPVIGNGGGSGGGVDDPFLDENYEPFVKADDVWALGSHRLFCGDSDDIENHKLASGDLTPTMLLTDPPYGMNLDTDYSKISGGWSGQISYTTSRRYAPVLNDDKPFNPATLLFAYEDCREVFMFGADYYRDSLPAGGCWFVWDETDGGRYTTVGSEFELVWSQESHRRSVLRFGWAGAMGLQHEDTRKRIHPTQKPVRLLTWFLENYAKEGDVIADPYIGSGSTLIACEQAGYPCVAIDYDAINCDKTIIRWQELTGKEATKID